MPGAGGGSVHKLYIKCESDCNASALADKAKTALDAAGARSTLNPARRLTQTITSTGADQDTAMCSNSQATCDQSEFYVAPVDPVPSPQPAPEDAPAPAPEPAAGNGTSNSTDPLAASTSGASHMAISGAAALVLLAAFSA